MFELEKTANFCFVQFQKVPSIRKILHYQTQSFYIQVHVPFLLGLKTFYYGSTYVSYQKECASKRIGGSVSKNFYTLQIKNVKDNISIWPTCKNLSYEVGRYLKICRRVSNSLSQPIEPNSTTTNPMQIMHFRIYFKYITD